MTHQTSRFSFRSGPRKAGILLAAAALCAAATPSALAQLRVANWNITNYNGGRFAEFRTAIYGSFEGRSMAPDIMVVQEVLSSSGVNNFLFILNTAPGSPGDWAAAPFINGNDTDNAFFYRTSKVDFLGVTTVLVGAGPPNPPRNVERYDIRLKGYTSQGAVLSCYSSHMKAGSGSNDQARRLIEAQAIRADAETLPADQHFLIGADFNIQSSSQAAYQELVGNQANNDGRFFDPISTPGSWNNNFAFRFVHTQDPGGGGGMDDRLDQILLKGSLVDGDGFEYLGLSNIPYSTTTWDDPNHSYRSWGNDGTSYNTSLTITNNQMVGTTIAQALVTSAQGQGHLPVFLDLLVPAKIDANTVLDFGTVPVGDTAQLDLDVFNAGDVAIWTDLGIADLRYSMSTTAGFSAPAGQFLEQAGGGANTHTITMDTAAEGVFTGTLTIASNAPDQPSFVVTLMGEVTGACLADLTGSADPNSPAFGVPDGIVDANDFFFYLGLFGAGDLAADLTGSIDPNDPGFGVPDGTLDANDFFFYLDLFAQGCG